MGEVLFLGLLGAVGGAMFLLSTFFRTSVLDKSGGPGMFPRIVVILLIFSAAIRIIQIVVKRETNKKFHFADMFRGIRLLYVLTTLAYMLAVPYVGYLISSIIYVVISVLYYRRREVTDRLSIRSSIGVGLINTALVVGIYFFFTQVVNIRLPAGVLGG